MRTIERIRESKDFPVIEVLIEHLKTRAPTMVPTWELAQVLGRPVRQVYGLIKIARLYLLLISPPPGPRLRLPNARGRSHGYWFSIDNARDGLFESIKSGDRADGHLAMEKMQFETVRQEDLKTAEDLDLFIYEKAKVRLGEARLKLSADIEGIVKRNQRNQILTSAAHKQVLTPWEELGLDDPTGDKNN